MFGILTWIWLLPLAGMILIIAIPKNAANNTDGAIRGIATLTSLTSLILSILVWILYDRGLGGFQFVEKLSWIPSFHISYHVGVDAISSILIILQGLVSFSGVLVSYQIKDRVKEYFIFFLALIASIYGVFLSLDIFFFYFFYEMAVIPMFPLIGIWGSQHKEYATMKLTLYISAGAVLALIGLLILYYFCPLQIFDLVLLSQYLKEHPLSPKLQIALFPVITIGFGVITSLWPFHTWSPIGYAAAPSAVSMLHAGVLKKLGAYAIIRFAVTLLPDGTQYWSTALAFLAAFNIVYCGWVAMAQKDMKFIVGYSSCSHMGYVLLGISSMSIIGLNGAVLLMFAHGVMAALTFALIGHCYHETHTRMVPDLGGIAKKMPFIATCFVFAILASCGLPGFANFVAELMIILGSWESHPVVCTLAVFGVVITATYLLRMIRGVLYGPPRPQWSHIRDSRGWLQRLPYVLLIAALILVGSFPSLFVRRIDNEFQKILRSRTIELPRYLALENKNEANLHLSEKKKV